MSIDAKEARRIVLLQANEGYSGLYEVIWELSTVRAGSTLGERYAATEQAVRALIERGWISLYRSRGRPEEIDPVTVTEVLSNPVSWYPEYAGVRIVFAATEDWEARVRIGRARRRLIPPKHTLSTLTFS